jgi:hypothetical protein
LYVSGTDANALITGQYVNQTSSANETASKFNSTEFGLTEKDTGYNLLMLTMLNIQSDKQKLLISYFSIYLTTMICYVIQFKFWRTTSVWGDINFEKGMDAYFSELKNYVVMVRGIPKNLHPEIASVELKRTLQKTYKDQLVDFKIVGEYKELHMLGRRWKSLCDQLTRFIKAEKLLKDLETGKLPAKKEVLINRIISNTNTSESVHFKLLDYLCCEKPCRKSKDELTPLQKKRRKALKWQRFRLFRFCRPFTSEDAKREQQRLRREIQKVEIDLQITQTKLKPRNIGVAFMMISSKVFTTQKAKVPRFIKNWDIK